MSNSTESDTNPSDLPHVVLVDGNDRERSELAEQVRAEEYRVTEADGGREALDILSAESVDLVLTDILLADIGGWDLLDKVKEAFPYVHGVVMTGSITDQEAPANPHYPRIRRCLTHYRGKGHQPARQRLPGQTTAK